MRSFVLLLLLVLGMVSLVLVLDEEAPDPALEGLAGDAGTGTDLQGGPTLIGGTKAAPPTERILKGWVYRAGRTVDASVTIEPPPEKSETYRSLKFDALGKHTTVKATANEGFEIPVRQGGWHRVRVDAVPHTLTRKVGVPKEGPVQPITLVLPSGPHRVRVRLLDSEGNPALRSVYAEGSAVAPASFYATLGPVQPDADGRLVISGLETGTLKLLVPLGPDHVLTSAAVRIPHSDEVVIVIPTALHTLKGLVRNARSRQPVPTAEVRVAVKTRDGARWRGPLRPTERGHFHCEVPEGQVSVYVRAPSYSARKHDVEDPTQAVQVSLVPNALVEGLVIEAATGTPVAGAVIQVFGADDLDFSPSLMPGDANKSAADGRFSIPLSRMDAAMVFVCDGDWVSRGLAVVREEGVNPFVLTDLYTRARNLVLEVERAGSARVRVVDPEGKPVAGCMLELWQMDWVPNETLAFRMGHGTPLSRSAMTDANGRAFFDSLVPGWQYRFHVDDYTQWYIEHDSEDEGLTVVAGTVTEARCIVRRNPDYEAPTPDTKPKLTTDAHVSRRVPLRLVVVNGRGKPIAGARVELYETGATNAQVPAPRGLRTAVDGIVEIRDLANRDVYVEVSIRGHLSPSRLRVTPAEAELRILLERALYIRGTARRDDGKLIEHALIEVRGTGKEIWRKHRATTEWEGGGVFEVGPLEAGHYVLDFFDSDDVRTFRAQVEASAGDDHVTVLLAADAPKEQRGLTVRAPDGQLVKAFLMIALHADKDGRESNSMWSTYTGRMKIYGASRWRPTWFEIIKPAEGFSGQLPLGARRLGPFAPGKTPTTLEVTLSPEKTIEGRVLDPEGRPVAGVRLEAYARPSEPLQRTPHRWAHAETWSDAAGHYRLGRLGDLVYDLRVSAPPHLLGAVFRDLRPGGAGKDLTLRAAGAVILQVVDEAGRALPGARVSVRSTDKSMYLFLTMGNRPLIEAKTNATGTARVDRLDLGARYGLSIRPPRERKDLRELSVGDWRPAGGTHALVAKSFVTGVVVDRLGHPLERVRVGASTKADGKRRFKAYTKADGRFRVTGFAAGPVKLTFHVNGLPERPSRATRAPMEDLRVELDLGASLRISPAAWPEGVDYISVSLMELGGQEPARIWQQSAEPDDSLIFRGIVPARAHALYAVGFDKDAEPLVAFVPRVPPGTSDVQLDFKPGLTLKVRLEGPAAVLDRRPVIRIHERGVIKKSNTNRDTKTGGWRGLPEGRFRVTAERTVDGVRWSGAAVIEAGTEGLIVLTPDSK